MKIYLLNIFLTITCLWPDYGVCNTIDSLSFLKKQKLAVGIQASTFGLGATVHWVLPTPKRLSLEVGYTFLRFIKDQHIQISEESEVFLQPDVHHSMVTALLSWYPFQKKNIFVKSGLGYNFGQKYFVHITSPTGLELGGLEIAADDFGDIDIGIKWNKLMPYLGIGFGRELPKKKVDVVFNIGTFYMGSPKINTRFEGFLETTTLDAEVVKIQRNLKNYSYFPFLGVNVRYKIGK